MQDHNHHHDEQININPRVSPGLAALGAPGEVLERYRQAARRDHDSDWIQVDQSGPVQLQDDGRAWVSGWIRVDPSDLDQCDACQSNPPQDPSGRLDDPWGRLCGECADRASETMDREGVSLRRAIRMIRSRVKTKSTL
jgi:hypothetical protein